MARIWGVHAIVLVAVLGASLAYLAGNAQDFAAAVKFFWIPIAAIYAVVSTALVALFEPGRGGVAVVHVLALVLAAVAVPFLVTIH
jgi:hypothetical protein